MIEGSPIQGLVMRSSFIVKRIRLRKMNIETQIIICISLRDAYHQMKSANLEVKYLADSQHSLTSRIQLFTITSSLLILKVENHWRESRRGVPCVCIYGHISYTLNKNQCNLERVFIFCGYVELLCSIVYSSFPGTITGSSSSNIVAMEELKGIHSYFIKQYLNINRL